VAAGEIRKLLGKSDEKICGVGRMPEFSLNFHAGGGGNREIKVRYQDLRGEWQEVDAGAERDLVRVAAARDRPPGRNFVRGSNHGYSKRCARAKNLRSDIRLQVPYAEELRR